MRIQLFTLISFMMTATIFFQCSPEGTGNKESVEHAMDASTHTEHITPEKKADTQVTDTPSTQDTKPEDTKPQDAGPQDTDPPKDAGPVDTPPADTASVEKDTPDTPNPTPPDFKFPTPQAMPTSNHAFTSTHFSGSDNCSKCHDGITDQSGKDVSIVKAWSSTMMANSTRDPFWQAKVESEIARNPQHKALLVEKCTRCHAPMANHEAKKSNSTFDLFGSQGWFQTSSKHFHQAMDGVSCTGCHQIKPTAEMGTLAGFSGKYVIESFPNPVDRKIYGPYKDIVNMPMRNDVSFTPVGSDHITQSKFCASCHNLKTPFVDSKGTVISKTPTDEFPEQMIYTEWENSDFSKGAQAKSCQNCHMAPTSGVVIARRPPWLNNKRSHFGQHIFVGGNNFMLKLMKDNRSLLGISANNFDFTIQKTADMLASAAKLDITQKSYAGGTLQFKVKVTNLSGHKLPSGYPSRRVYLHVAVKDQQGKIVFESGKIGAYGAIDGVDADADPNAYEGHHDVITKPSQVQVYESIMGNTDGGVTYTLLRGAKYLKDNRLLPKGFPKASAPSDVAVHGAAKTDSNFVAGQDEVTYRVANLSASKLNVEVSLRYQMSSYRYVVDVLKERGTYAQKFGYMYAKAKSFSSPITSTSFSF